jgi:GNAT superfamily N-acetyltransferase
MPYGVAIEAERLGLGGAFQLENARSAVGAALVLRSEHVTGWKGPWVMNVFRSPEPPLPGVGQAMLVRALDVLREDGETHVGLAVTATNPARRVYERLGFSYDFEGWIVVLPGGDPH